MTASSPSLSDTDERAIRNVVATADSAQNDPDGLLPLHTEDAVIVNIAGRRVCGRDAFSAAMTGALSSPLRDIRTSVEVVDIRRPGPDVAVVSCRKTVHDERAEADRTALPTVGALTYVMVRSADGWLISLAQTTPIVT